MTQILSSPAELLRFDTAGMMTLLEDAPARARRHFQQGQRHPLPSQRPRQILICGMGGSGSTGDLLQALCPESRIPVLVNKSPALPAWVGPETLVIGVSYSGGTAETLQALTRAREAGAQLHLFSAGGALQAFAETHALGHVPLEGGLPPRAALLDMLFALMGSLQTLDLLNLPADPLAGLDFLTAQTPAIAEQALTLARQLQQPMLMLWGADPVSALIALRWKNQFSENSKRLAFCSALPELNHNEMVAMCASCHSQTQLLYLTLASEIAAFDRVSLDLVRAHVAEVILVPALGRNHLEKVLFLTCYGDFVSVWLALLQAIDPTPIAAIDEFKRRIALLSP
jgi:glucose/mannose-6-phosphate isomerase